MMKKHVMAALLALALAIGMLQGAALAAKPGGDRVQAGQAGSRLTGVDREVYRVLREEVAKIAGGSRSSTAIRIPDLDALSWGLKELGAEGKDQQKTGNHGPARVKDGAGHQPNHGGETYGGEERDAAVLQ